MSWKENDFSLTLTTPYPFLRRVEVNFAAESGYLYVMSTGEWGKDLEMIPMVHIGDESFIAEKADTERVLDLLSKKYGQFHTDKYFKEPMSAFSLIRGTFNYDPESVISRVFDSTSETYERDIMENSTQRYMREVTQEILKKYYFRGANLLDLGAGVMYETRQYVATSKLSAVEGSLSLRKLIREQFSPKEKENLEVYDNLEEVASSGQKYDIIFSTFGYLELNSLKHTLEIVRELLNPQGIFIAGFWNSKGWLDNLVSLMQGRFEYVSGKRKELVPVGQSKYGLAAFPRKIADFTHFDGLVKQEVRGICTIIPPYNYGVSKKISRNVLIRRLDQLIGRVPFISSYSDFIVVVLNKRLRKRSSH